MSVDCKPVIVGQVAKQGTGLAFGNRPPKPTREYLGGLGNELGREFIPPRNVGLAEVPFGGARTVGNRPRSTIDFGHGVGRRS